MLATHHSNYYYFFVNYYTRPSALEQISLQCILHVKCTPNFLMQDLPNPRVQYSVTLTLRIVSHQVTRPVTADREEPRLRLAITSFPLLRLELVKF